MGNARRNPTRWPASAGVLLVVLVIGTGGLAVTARSSPHGTGPSALAVAGVAEQGAPTEQAVVPVTTTTAPVTRASGPAPTSATTRPPASTVARPLPAPIPPTVPLPTTLAPGAPTTRGTPPAAATLRTSPSSWTLDDVGISSYLRVEPAAPHVGDTVTITFGSSATVPTDFCCIENLYVDGTLVFTLVHGQGPCPLAQAPAEQKVTYVLTHAGTLDIHLQSNRVKLCIAPPEFTTTNLDASFGVLPAA
jgi:hypothetical protein